MRQSSASARPRSESEPKIGEHVRQTMLQLANAGRLTPYQIGNLLNARYCKLTFNLAYPFFRVPDEAVASSSLRSGRNGQARYWSKPLNFGQHKFYMCNHSFEPQRVAFDRWVRELE